MAKGLRDLSHADCAVSVTGIAGPGGGSAEKPVGLVYMGLAIGDKIFVKKNLFHGNSSTLAALPRGAIVPNLAFSESGLPLNCSE